jgi:hypothetical protein
LYIDDELCISILNEMERSKKPGWKKKFWDMDIPTNLVRGSYFFLFGWVGQNMVRDNYFLVLLERMGSG